MPNVSPKPYKQAMREFHDLTQSLADRAWTLYTENIYDLLYIVGKRTAGIDTLNPRAEIWTEFSIDRDGYQNTDYLLVHGENIRRNATLEMMRDQIESVLKREPSYIFAD